MAFIVEMLWGKPNSITVMGFNEDRELVPKYTIPSDTFDPERREFSCHGDVWDDLIKFGKAYGWEPMGTRPSPNSEEYWEKNGGYEENYKPDDGFTKMVTGEDALNWARALEKVLGGLENGTLKPEEKHMPVLIREGMTKEEYDLANCPFGEKLLRDFITFLRKGPFMFAWDD